jgi:hypothetical protein
LRECKVQPTPVELCAPDSGIRCCWTVATARFVCGCRNDVECCCLTLVDGVTACTLVIITLEWLCSISRPAVVVAPCCCCCYFFDSAAAVAAAAAAVGLAPLFPPLLKVMGRVTSIRLEAMKDHQTTHLVAVCHMPHGAAAAARQQLQVNGTKLCAACHAHDGCWVRLRGAAAASAAASSAVIVLACLKLYIPCVLGACLSTCVLICLHIAMCSTSYSLQRRYAASCFWSFRMPHTAPCMWCCLFAITDESVCCACCCPCESCACKAQSALAAHCA